MKRLILIICLFLLGISANYAAKIENIPLTIVQPNGQKIDCFASGDEFFNYLHDKDGYTIVQAVDGYYYYAKLKAGDLVPSSYKVGVADPSLTNLKTNLVISREKYSQKRDFYEQSWASNTKANLSFDAPYLNNVSIQIRFSDDEEFTKEAMDSYDTLFNGSTKSLKHYYNETSYGKLAVQTYLWPYMSGKGAFSYVDSYPRGYYRPYNATTNPEGYKNMNTRMIREWELLARAINWLDENTPMSEDVDLDANKDNYIDNVTFVVRGRCDGWNDLLWAHRATLSPSYNAKLNGKQVATYIFMPENQCDIRTSCHEFFHALGAPDLYHYSSEGPTPIGYWDLMEHGSGHISTLMKHRYTNWITLSDATKNGYYKLKPLSSNDENPSIKIPIPNDNYQSLIVEYRKNEGLYESELPGHGVLVYRYNELYDGNADYNGSTRMDMLYVFRPNGTSKVGGDLNSAHFNQELRRTEVNDSSSPTYLFRTRGEATGVSLYGITVFPDSALVGVYFGKNFDPTEVRAVSVDGVTLEWKNNSEATKVMIVESASANIEIPLENENYAVGDILYRGGKVIYFGDLITTYSDKNIAPGEKKHYTVYSYSEGRYSKGVMTVAFGQETEYSCDISTNIAENEKVTTVEYKIEAPFKWGYEAGHNSGRINKYAEKYVLDYPRVINSVDLNIAKLSVSSQDPNVELWIANAYGQVPLLEKTESEANAVIGDVIYKQRISLKDMRLGNNKIKLTTPVKVSDDFFVGYTINYSDVIDTIALFMAEPDSQRQSTAYYEIYKKWQGFAETKTLFTSIDIKTELCTGVENKTDYFYVYPQVLGLPNRIGVGRRIGVWTGIGHWTVESAPDWVDIVSDYANNTILVYAKEGTSENIRRGEVVISSKGERKTIVVEQGKMLNQEETLKTIKCKVYPNPSSTGYFTLNADVEGAKIVLTDFSGRVINSFVMPGKEMEIDLSDQPTGMYFLRISSYNSAHTAIKLIKR